MPQDTTNKTMVHSNRLLIATLSLILLAIFSPAYAADDEEEGVTSAPIPKTAKVNAPKSREFWHITDIGHRLDPNKVKMLLAGTDEFAVVTREDFTGRTKGVAILLPDWNSSTNASVDLANLRVQLNDYGWVTMASTIPDKPGFQPVAIPEASAPTSPDTTAPSDSAESEESSSPQQPAKSSALAPPFAATAQSTTLETQITSSIATTYRQLLNLRINSLYQEAENYPGFFIVLTKGCTAASLMRLVAEQQIEPPEAIILISAFCPDPDVNEQLNLDIAQTNIPILELYRKTDSSWVTVAMPRRKKLAYKYFKPHYRQRELFSTHHSSKKQERLLKEVYGWLTKMGM